MGWGITVALVLWYIACGWFIKLMVFGKSDKKPVDRSDEYDDNASYEDVS